MDNDFVFLNPGELIDGDIKLTLATLIQADANRNFVPTYGFEIRYAPTEEPMGTITLRVGDNENIYYGGHIGYGVSQQFRGHRLAARSVKLLLPFAKSNGLNPVYITCNPDNLASRRTCEIGGGILEEIVDLPPHNDQYLIGERQKCRYRFEL